MQPPQAPLRSLVGASALVLLLLLLASPLQLLLPVHLGAGLSTLLALGLATAWVRVRWSVPLAPGSTRAATLLLAALAGAMVALSVNSFQVLKLAFVPTLQPLAERYAEAIAPLLALDAPHLIPVVFLVIALLPGLLEERFFRGALRERVAHWGPFRRIVVIAFLFALVHLNPLTFVALLVAGLAFGWIAERSAGWFAAAAAHVFFNATSGILWPRLPDVVEQVPNAAGILVVAGLVSLALLRLLSAFGPTAGARDAAGSVPGRT